MTITFYNPKQHKTVHLVDGKATREASINWPELTKHYSSNLEAIYDLKRNGFKIIQITTL